MRLVLTGGGTGGHVVPNLAVIEELRRRGGHPKGGGVDDLLYIGSKNGVEKSMAEKAGVAYEGVYCGKFRRYLSLRNFVDFFKVPIGILQARRVLRRFKPDVIFSKGGFVGMPVVMAAKWLKIPVILHESDARMGLANRMAMKYANKICISFEETKAHIDSRYMDKVVFTGNPVRKSILKGSADEGFKFTGLDHHRPVILIMGGSQGALQINNLVRGSLNELLKKFQIVHVRGRGNLDISLKARGYVQFEYIDEEMADLYAMSEMIVSRGGANSLTEIALWGKKALIIPLGTAASRGDQPDNARIFANKLSWGVLEGDITSEQFIKAMEMSFLNNVSGGGFENGVDEIVDLIMKYA